jgi:hypothetical protein
MPASHNRVDPTTVAYDALYAAGLTLRGMDLRTFDPLRVILAERFAGEARRCRGDVEQLAARITPLLDRAVLEARLQIEAEGRMQD